MDQFINFVIAGIITVGIRMSVTPFCKEVIGLPLGVSYAFSLLCVIIFGFIVNHQVIFRDKQNPKIKFCLYVLAIFLFSCLDWVIVKGLSTFIPYLFVIIPSACLIFLLKFVVYKKVIFVDYFAPEGGNLFDKYGSKNPVVQFLMHNFIGKFISLATENQGNTCIDIGCGEGNLTNAIYHATHMKMDSYEYDKGTAEKANKMYPHLNIKQGDIMNLSGEYDLLISSEVLEHIKDYDTAIKQCKKTAPVCIFSVPRTPWFQIANLCRLKYINRLGETPGHINHWTKGRFSSLLKKHFNSVEIHTSFLWTLAVCKSS